ncbi:GntR family transcriptional regulator [Mycolicibacterium sp. P1-18]|uniref:GntR family transcriptional regulator n=1 Tax=Mycolicibacterium sp. P1-18 TaxID=2024615 RepID=UPI0011F3EC02|nr:GntR family transcriptional regulator [Mycolicibacterium sp. P1-18]KAA0094619.1 GntR family transcriptional regulator [Mycolicibacterium sp. P1-18]
MEEPCNGTARVSADAGVPLHRQLYLVLHDEISRGALASGDALPTEQTLCDMFGVSRITVRRALADLSDAGLVDRRHGVGSFVTRPASSDGSHLDAEREVESETDVEVIECGVRSLPPAVGARWDSRDDALYVLRLRRARDTGEPLVVTEAWLPVDLTAVVTESSLARAPLHRLISDAGVTLECLEHEMTAEIAGPRTASLLGTAIGSPLIRMNRVAFAADAPHHVLSTVMSPSKSRIVVNQNAMDMEEGGRMFVAHDVLRPTN